MLRLLAAFGLLAVPIALSVFMKLGIVKQLLISAGRMTGQILGGANPETAIKYQIAIVLAIFTALTISVALSIYFTSRKTFDSYGILKADLFRD